MQINTKKYHVFAPMGRFHLESIYLYFPPSSQLLIKLILTRICNTIVYKFMAVWLPGRGKCCNTTYVVYVVKRVVINYGILSSTYQFQVYLPDLIQWIKLKVRFSHEQIIMSIRINFPLFSTAVPSNICMFLSCRPLVVITTLSTGLVGVEVTSVSWLGQLTVGI